MKTAAKTGFRTAKRPSASRYIAVCAGIIFLLASLILTTGCSKSGTSDPSGYSGSGTKKVSLIDPENESDPKVAETARIYYEMTGSDGVGTGLMEMSVSGKRAFAVVGRDGVTAITFSPEGDSNGNKKCVSADLEKLSDEERDCFMKLGAAMYNAYAGIDDGEKLVDILIEQARDAMNSGKGTGGITGNSGTFMIELNENGPDSIIYC